MAEKQKHAGIDSEYDFELRQARTHLLKVTCLRECGIPRRRIGGGVGSRSPQMSQAMVSEILRQHGGVVGDAEALAKALDLGILNALDQALDQVISTLTHVATLGGMLSSCGDELSAEDTQQTYLDAIADICADAVAELLQLVVSTFKDDKWLKGSEEHESVGASTTSG